MFRTRNTQMIEVWNWLCQKGRMDYSGFQASCYTHFQHNLL